MSTVKLNTKLNLVIPVDQSDGVTIYVHSTPIGHEVFETYYKPIALAWTRIYAGGFTYASGPRVAKLILREVSQSLGMWDGAQGVQAGLIAEINRISNVLLPNGKGWEQIALEDAIRKKVFDPDDLSEVENAICFFIVACAMHKKAELKGVLEAVANIWGAQFVSLNITEFKNSLVTLTETDNTGEKPQPTHKKASSIPT